MIGDMYYYDLWTKHGEWSCNKEIPVKFIKETTAN